MHDVKTVGKLTAPDGWTFEYDFTQVPRTIVVCDETGEEKRSTTFYHEAGMGILRRHAWAFKEAHRDRSRLRLQEPWGGGDIVEDLKEVIEKIQSETGIVLPDRMTRHLEGMADRWVRERLLKEATAIVHPWDR